MSDIRLRSECDSPSNKKSKLNNESVLEVGRQENKTKKNKKMRAGTILTTSYNISSV